MNLFFCSRKYILLVLCILCGAQAFSKEDPDSLKAFISHPANEVKKAEAMIALSKFYRLNNPDSSLLYARAAFAIGEKHFPSTITNQSYLCLGIAQEIVKDYDSSAYFLDKAITYSEKYKDPKTLASAYNSMGLVSNKTGKDEKAIACYIKALKQHELNKDELGMALAYNNLGVMYKKRKQYTQAIEQYKNAWKLYEKNHEPNTLVLTNIAGVYFVTGKYKESISFLMMAKKIDEENNNTLSILRIVNNLTSVYLSMEDIPNAKKTNEESIVLAEKDKNYEQLVNAYDNKATILSMEKNGAEAVFYFTKAMETAKKIHDIPRAANLYKSLAEAYKNIKQYELAMTYALLYANTKDSLTNAENKKQIAEMQAKYESAQKDKELLQKDSELTKQQLEARQSSMQRNAFIVGFVLMMTLAFFILKGYREKKKANISISHQKDIIEQKQREMLDSIHYAQRIQRSLLPTEKYIDRTLKRLKK